MSISGPLMTISDRQKCFEERKQLESHPCRNHYVTLGVEIDTCTMLLTPESSPSIVSSHSYQNSLHHSTESLSQPPVSHCSVLTMPTSPHNSEHEQGSYIQQGAYSQAGSPHNSIGSPPVQLGSPYSAVSSPESQMMFSPPQQLPTSHAHVPPLAQPHCMSHSPPYQSNAASPGQFSAQGTSGQYPPEYPPHTMEEVGLPPQLIPFSNATCVGLPGFDGTQEPVIYSMPGHPMPVLETYSVGPHHLPPFAQAFENQLHEGRPEKHSSQDYCSSPEGAGLPIKQIPNEYGLAPIDFYHPPTPPTPEGHPGILCPPEMCGPPLPEMCGPLHPLPNHLCPIPTLATGRRRTKPAKRVPQIEVDDSDIKDIPTSAQLWEFTLRVLKKPKYKYMVSWEKREEGLFRFNNAQAFAALWGKHRNRPQMSYDKVARALRYYYKRNILEQVGGRLTYRFTKRLSKMYLSDV